MFVAKIDGANVKVFDAKSGSLKRTISSSPYKGVKSADVKGELVSITCGDGKVRIFDVKSGTLTRTI